MEWGTMPLKGSTSTQPGLHHRIKQLINSTCIYYGVIAMVRAVLYETFDMYQVQSCVFDVHRYPFILHDGSAT